MKHYIVAYKSLAYCLDEDQLGRFNQMRLNHELAEDICCEFEDQEISKCTPIECNPSEVFIYAYGYEVPRDKFDLFLDSRKKGFNLQQFEQYKV